MSTAVKPQSTEWIDSREGPPYVDFTFHYRSHGNARITISLIIAKLREMGLIPKSVLEEKSERSEFSDDSGSSSRPRSFWSFWSRS